MCALIGLSAVARAEGPQGFDASVPATATPNARESALETRLERLEAEVESLRAEAARTPVFQLKPTILGEIDYRTYPSEAEGNTGFALGRLRPGLALTASPSFRAVTVFDFAGEHPTVLDAFARYRAAEWVEFTAGYSKPPLFASFVYEPVHTGPFPDRSGVVSGFRVRRDLGVDVHFTPRKVPLEAWLRVGNGAGSALGNDNALPAGYASLDLVLGRAWVGADASKRKFGLRAGAGGLVESSRDRNGIGGTNALGFVYYRPAVISGLRVVGEAHAIAYAGPLRLTVEAAMAHEARSRDDDGDPQTPRVVLPAINSYGLTTELAWVINGTPRDVGRAPGRAGDGSGFGPIELALRYDGLWLGRGAADVRSGGSQGGAVGLKWWATPFLAASIAGYRTHYDSAPLEAPDEQWSWGAIARLSFFWGLPGLPVTGTAESGSVR